MCGTCNFERGQCGWTDVSSGRYNFHLFNGSSPGSGGPRTDHTTNSASGHYILVEGSTGQFYSRAHIETPVLGRTGPSCQIQFFYHMYGINAGNMRVLVQNANRTTDKTYIWSMTGNQGNSWKKAVVDIGQLPAGYKVQFEALPSRSILSGVPQSDMAFDDVTFINCGATVVDKNTTVNCTFENGFCNFRQVTTDDFDWTWTNTSTPTVGTGPDRDHTTGMGAYIYMETSSPRHIGERAVITSGIQAATLPGGQCLSFWYHMFGAHVSTLNVYLKTQGGNKTMIWSRSRTQGNVWRNGLRNIKSLVPYEILFEGIVGFSWQGDIALDDISLIQEKCPPSPICDFEADLCDWIQDTNDQFDWLRRRNGTDSKNTGPSVDHTTSSPYGYFLYIESSSPRRMYDLARITTPQFSNSQGSSCFTFWYHMYGTNVGNLTVYLQDGPQKKMVFQRKSNQVNLWIHSALTLRPISSKFQLIFEGTVGNGYQGDIAIDDVQVLPGKCPPIGNCNFEIDTCGWTNTNADNFDWLRSAGSTLTRGTGPSVDHTTNSDAGFYMYISALGRNAGQRAWFYSQYFLKTKATCMSFWYFMYGQDVGTLRLYQPTKNITSLLWSVSGNQGSSWRNVQINITSNITWQVTFDGQIGKGIQGNIAIDDVIFTPGICNGVIPTFPSPTFSTLPTPTYPPTPYDCTFENQQQPICSWTQDTSDQFNWTPKVGSTGSLNTGPTFDHTLQNRNGKEINNQFE
ncbi:MAM and LDL-receptor class A domain-containing protein 1-like isoform X2 [Ruditapes philippinarum]|nr:MAM and LDL-receptor class A domain-containing protein 1-like isoform X2 [Ruditapes philippinarum]